MLQMKSAAVMWTKCMLDWHLGGMGQGAEYVSVFVGSEYASVFVGSECVSVFVGVCRGSLSL